MKMIPFSTTGIEIPTIAIGCMRFSEKSVSEVNRFIHLAYENGAYFMDHANIYGGGKCEELFGEAMKSDSSLKRENFFIQSKCGIRKECYDQSKKHIISSVESILKRLQTDYLDSLLIHRPDASLNPKRSQKHLITCTQAVRFVISVFPIISRCKLNC